MTKIKDTLGEFIKRESTSANESVGIVKGAKWQEQNSDKKYSEEDMKEAYFSAIKSTGEGWNGEYAGGNGSDVEVEFSEGFSKWFEQFKNK